MNARSLFAVSLLFLSTAAHAYVCQDSNRMMVIETQRSAGGANVAVAKRHGKEILNESIKRGYSPDADFRLKSNTLRWHHTWLESDSGNFWMQVNTDSPTPQGFEATYRIITASGGLTGAIYCR